MMNWAYNFNGQLGSEAFLGGVPSLIVILYLAGAVFWIWMLVDMVRRPVKNKTMWAIILIFGQFIGAVIYCFTGRKSVEMPATKTPHHEHKA